MANLNSVKLILPENPSPSTLFAADELDFVFSLCGLKKPERALSPAAGEKFISLGDTAVKNQYGFKAVKSIGGGYSIRTRDENYFIYSYEPSGVINGVYGFLERAVGYRFYAMDEIRVDRRDVYETGEINADDQPDFAGRRLDSFNLYHNAVYALRLRQNESCADPDPRLGEGTLWSELHDQSLAFQLVPYEKYKTGENIAKGWWSEKGDQLCWTKAFYDDELFELLCASLIDDIRRESDKKFFMLGQTDNPYYCECETCKRDYARYGVSGVMVRLANKLAALIYFTCQGYVFFQAGEEFGRTKLGDDNSYRSAPELNMLRWAQTQEFSDLLAYYKGLIALRKQMPGLYDKSPAAYARISQETVHATGVVSFLLDNRGEGAACPWTRLWILYNASQQTASVPVPTGNWSVLADGAQVGTARPWVPDADGAISVPPTTGMILGEREEAR